MKLGVCINAINLHFNGESPPSLEVNVISHYSERNPRVNLTLLHIQGVAYELSQDEFNSIKQLQIRNNNDNQNKQWIQLKAKRIDSISGLEFQEVAINMFVLNSTLNSQPRLQPTQRYLRAILIGSHLSSLSQPFLGHLSLLRHFKPNFKKRLMSLIVTTIMLPRFLFSSLLTVLNFKNNHLVKGTSLHRGISHLSSMVQSLEIKIILTLEKLMKPVVGSGFTNEERGFD
ncbi:hypothetical protein OIO90_006142 [Microbotryomycetes sp. JL221]|nr:hypothetical protein OIO90_006142 [Microbotryomycetes sp. JL221]